MKKRGQNSIEKERKKKIWCERNRKSSEFNEIIDEEQNRKKKTNKLFPFSSIFFESNWICNRWVSMWQNSKCSIHSRFQRGSNCSLFTCWLKNWLNYGIKKDERVRVFECLCLIFEWTHHENIMLICIFWHNLCFRLPSLAIYIYLICL